MRLIAKLWFGLNILAAGVAGSYLVAPAIAGPSQSANFRFDESSIGGTGFLNTQSTSYQAAGSAGVLGLGNSASSALQVYAGPNTTGDPALSFAVNNSTVNFGNFSPTSTAVATSTFQVVNYTSYGYVVHALGTPPSKGSREISPMSTTGTSQSGVEQFGINLVANTSPVSLGSNPDNSQFGFGVAAANYATPNNYRYVSGETIASAPKSSGVTIYTISYIINVGNLTPAGEYISNQTILCTGTY